MKPKFIFVLVLTFSLGALPFSGDRSGPRDIRLLFEAVGKSDTSEFGLQVLGAGDQNQDGYADVVAWARREAKMYLFYGGSPTDSLPDLVFTNAYRGATADVNGDGVPDFAFGAIIGNRGYVRLYYGGVLLDTIPDLRFSSPDSGQGFGIPYAIGDFNGDGYEDIAISELAFPNQQFQGKVRVFFGGVPMDSLADWVAQGDSARYTFGVDIAGGDLNADGYSDLIVFGRRLTWTNAPAYAKIFFGGGLPDTIPRLTLDALQTFFPFTAHGRAVGDVNGDGYNDFCLSVGGYRDTAALVFYGGNPFDLIPDKVLRRSFQPAGNIPGFVVAGAGDINRDGYADIVLGNRNAFSGFGEVLVYLGGPNMSSDFAFGFTGLGNPYDGAGVSVGRCNDVNGDRVDDIMFGAWNGDPGSNNYPGRVEIFSGDSTITGITEPGNAQLPLSFHLYQNYPNPFNGETTIKFSIPSVNSLSLIVHVSLSIYDVQGKEVRTLLKEEVLLTGDHAVRWDATDNAGRLLSSGIYFYRLSVNGHALTNKMVLLR